MKNKKLISVIIATFNVEDLIERTLESVYNQTYKNIELIVVDGKSTDQSVAVLNRHITKIDYLISEPDTGIYDAWNKGILLSRGDYIAFLGAGDAYYPDALFKYVEYINLQKTQLDFISSRVQLVNESEIPLYVVGSKWEWPKFLKYMTTAHVGALHARQLFSKYGLFDPAYKIAGDYELLLRPKGKLNAGFIPDITVKMLYGGISNSTKIFKEVRRIKLKTGEMSVIRTNLEFCGSVVKKNIRTLLNSMGLYIFIKK